MNVGGTLVRSDLGTSAPRYNDLLACADLDSSGLPDIVGRWLEPVGVKPDGTPLRAGRFRVYRNRSAPGPPLRVRVLGANGARNQQGRIVRVRPLAGPDVTLVRVVESGSGLLAQNGYDVLVPAPWPGPYEVSVRFADGWVVDDGEPGRRADHPHQRRGRAGPPLARPTSVARSVGEPGRQHAGPWTHSHARWCRRDESSALLFGL